MDKNIKKMSINMTTDNIYLIDRLCKKLHMKYSPLINHIISVILGMPDDVQKSIIQHCRKEYIHLNKSLGSDAAYHNQAMQHDMAALADIAAIISGGDVDITVPQMVHIRMADGYVTVPDDWIIVNLDDATDSRFASVIEIRNAAQYDAPHFVYFHSQENISEKDEKEIYNLCENKWDKFTDVLKLSNNALDNYQNLELFNESPIVGIFPIFTSDMVDNPPYGAMIIRDGTN